MTINEAINQALYDYNIDKSEYHQIILDALMEKENYNASNKNEYLDTLNKLKRDSIERENRLAEIEDVILCWSNAYNEGKMFVVKYPYQQEVWVVNGEWVGNGEVIAFAPVDSGMMYMLFNKKHRSLDSIWFHEDDVYLTYEEAYEAARKHKGRGKNIAQIMSNSKGMDSDILAGQLKFDLDTSKEN